MPAATKGSGVKMPTAFRSKWRTVIKYVGIHESRPLLIRLKANQAIRSCHKMGSLMTLLTSIFFFVAFCALSG